MTPISPVPSLAQLPLTPPPTDSRLGSPFTIRPSPPAIHKSPILRHRPAFGRPPIRRTRRAAKGLRVPPTPTPSSAKSHLHNNDQFSIQSTLHHAILNDRLPWLPVLDLDFDLDYQLNTNSLATEAQSIPIHHSELADLSIFDCLASQESPLALVENEDEQYTDEEVVISRPITPQSPLPIRGRRRTLFPTSTQDLALLPGPFSLDSPPSSADYTSSFGASPPPRSPSPLMTKTPSVMPSDLPFAAQFLESQEAPRTPSPIPRKRRRIARATSPSPTRFSSPYPYPKRPATPPCANDSVQELGSPYATPSPRFYNLMPVLAPYEDDDDVHIEDGDAMCDSSDVCSDYDESEESEAEGVWPFGSPSKWLAPIFRSPLLRSRTPWTPHANHLPLPAFATPDA